MHLSTLVISFLSLFTSNNVTKIAELVLCYRFLYLNLLLFLYAYLSFAYGCYRKYVVFVINYDVLVYSGNLLCMFIFGAYMHVKYMLLLDLFSNKNHHNMRRNKSLQTANAIPNGSP